MSAEAEEGCCVWTMNMFIVFFFLFFEKAETRAEFAERTVAKLEKTIDDLEGTLHFNPFFFLNLVVIYAVLNQPLFQIFILLNP